MTSPTALDRRLTATATPSPAVLVEVMRDHDCEQHQACPVCGHVPTRAQPLCRSAAVAASLRWRRRPRWTDPAPRPAPDPLPQGALFLTDGDDLRSA